jgi:histidine triad (HIT) family protein
MSCIFCKIIDGKLPSNKVFEDDLCIAFMDINPINPGHVLVVPRVCERSVADIDGGVAGHLVVVANKINRALRSSGIRCEGINYFLADGRSAGQEVDHAHLHVIPRFKDDGFKLVFPESYKNKPDKEALKGVAENVVAALKHII